jgi:hypothetical protein
VDFLPEGHPLLFELIYFLKENVELVVTQLDVYLQGQGEISQVARLCLESIKMSSGLHG